MPFISTYGWPKGSIVTPTRSLNNCTLYRVGEEYRIEGSGDSQMVVHTGNGASWNGLDADWELVRFPHIAEYGFPQGSTVRLLSYNKDSHGGSNGIYGPVGTTGKIVGELVKTDTGLWVGDLGVWELVEAAVEEGGKMIPGNRYIIVANNASHYFYEGEIVICDRAHSDGKHWRFSSISSGEGWWVTPSDVVPFDENYQRTYLYITNLSSDYQGCRKFTGDYHIPTKQDRSAFRIVDNKGSGVWLYRTEEGDCFKVECSTEPKPFDTALTRWGTDYDKYIQVSREFWQNPAADFIREEVSELVPDVNVHARVQHFMPVQSRKVRGQIAIYQTRQKQERDLHTAMKPGRMFKFMFPELSDAQVEVLVDKYRQRFPVTEYKLHVADDQASFKFAYSGTQEPMQNPYTTSARKSLANSCMRYDFNHLPHHPAEAYASGEFKVFYTTGPRGYIGSRCVVWYGHKSGRPVAGPIYGVCEHSIDIIAEALEKENAFMYGEESWKGAKMLKLPHDGGVIGPYLDGGYQWLSDRGDHLTIQDCGDYDASSYNGVLGGHDYSCAECGEGVHEEDVYYSDHHDQHYCQSCYRDTHTRCDHYDEYYPNDEIVTVYYMLRGRRRELQVSERAVNNGYYIYCESDGEYWKEDDVVMDHNDEYLDPITAESDYFLCAWTDKYWPNDQVAELADGTLVALSEVEADEEYFLNDNGKYEKKEAA